MGIKVELINNPYKRRLRILINGEAVSVYSNLEKYMDEPFCYWCDKILDSIYEECNFEDFQLHFSSRKEELEIMESIAGNYAHCIQYSSAPPMRPMPLLERIKGLNSLIREARGSGYHTFKKDILFIIPESLQRFQADLAGLEVRNSFCQINAKTVFYADYGRMNGCADICILISDGPVIEKHLRRLGVSDGFGIELGAKRGFKQKTGNLFLYESTETELFETIFDCLLLSPLMDMFCSCVNTLSTDLREKYRERIEDLQSTEVKVIPVPEKTIIEEGRSSRIRFETDVEGYQIKSTQLHYSYSEKGIIRCNGLLVEGLKAGKATLNIFKEGGQIPCASVDYTVIRRNRIKELRLDESRLLIGEGDSASLTLTYLPKDADNADLIEWESDDRSIAQVDKRGNVKGISRGTCTIRCFAEQVSASCRCLVKPHLKSIISDVKELELVYGQEREIKINLNPEDCIDGKIVITSMDMRTVNIVGKTLKAIGIGKTRVIIQNREETVRTEISVQVMTEKEYKKLQRQRAKNQSSNSAKEKKEGWLSKLFG